MENIDYKKIGIVFEKNPDGKYSYKSTELFDSTEASKKLYNESNVIQIDETKYSSLKQKDSTRFLTNNMQERETLVLELSESLYKTLLAECELKGYSQEEGLDTIKKLLEYIAKNIGSIQTKQHGNIVSIEVGFEKERKKAKEMNGKDTEEENTTTITEEFPKIDMSKVNPDEIIEKIKKKVIAQDKTVASIVNNIYNNQLIFESGDENLISSSKSSILMDGPTGTGKTLIIKQVAKELELPMIIRSSTMYSAAGYKGSDLSEMLVGLLEKTGGNLEAAERGIIVLDEFDKLGGKGDSELEMKKAVQQELLTYLSGAKFPVEYKGKTYEFDTSKITFICLGAFTDLRERKIKEELDSDGYYSMKPEDYIEEGLLREIVGRFSLITATQGLSKEDLITILNKSEISPLVQLTNLGKNIYQKEIVYDDVMIDKIATLALEEDTGARALQTVVNGIRDVILPDLRDSNMSVIEITDEILTKSKETDKRKGVRK